jgi:hypothetical protein
MPHVRREVIPDIVTPFIVIESETKYETMLNENIKNVSVIGLIRMKLQCLKTKAVKNPKISPIVKDIVPSIINYPKIIKGVAAVKF